MGVLKSNCFMQKIYMNFDAKKHFQQETIDK